MGGSESRPCSFALHSVTRCCPEEAAPPDVEVVYSQSLTIEDVAVPPSALTIGETKLARQTTGSTIDSRFGGFEAGTESTSMYMVGRGDLRTGDSGAVPNGKRLSRQLTRVAAGHGGNTILKDVETDYNEECGIPAYVIKLYDEMEVRNYELLQTSQDPMLQFTPAYHGLTLPTMMGEGGQPETYMRLSNLLKAFSRGPHVTDCKIGIRSFGEDEAAVQKPRPDLYKRLVALDPNAPTPEERAKGSCTKYRWMTFQDSVTTLNTLGFRIDGIANSMGPGGRVSKSELQSLRTVQEAAHTLAKHFLPERGPCAIGEDSTVNGGSGPEQPVRASIARAILSRIKEMKATMMISPFVRSHSFVGSSLLFVADSKGPESDVFLIDFAKTIPLPEGVSITHSAEWKAGNHEDGLFTGMDNVIQCWEEIVAMEGRRLGTC